MKRSALFSLMIILALLPATTAFAQDTAPESCDFTAVFDFLVVENAAIRGWEGFTEYLNLAAEIGEQCAGEWVELLFGVSSSASSITATALDPFDGILTAEEAVLGVESAFLGDQTTAA